VVLEDGGAVLKIVGMAPREGDPLDDKVGRMAGDRSAVLLSMAPNEGNTLVLTASSFGKEVW
jgi:hypothetical protein